MVDNDFTLTSYRRILETGLANGYRFVSYGEIGREGAPLTCLLRHDVDSELYGLAPIMGLERELGISATYFVMTRSTAYNLFCVEGRQVVRCLLDSGHRIGLHFMGELCELDGAEELAAKAHREAEWLEAEFGTRIEAVSFHQPSQAMLDGQLQLPGLVNTYNKTNMGSYFYVSDTNMMWRHEHPADIFARRLYARLQLLIHPMWWSEKPLGLAGKWKAVLEANRHATLEHWRARERTFRGLDAEDL